MFVIGDLMALDHLPGVAQVAIQSAEHAAGQIVRRLRGDQAGEPFRYKDEPGLAPGLPRRYKNRLTTLLHWAHSFIGRGRAERVVTER